MSSSVAFNQVIRLVAQTDLEADVQSFLLDRQARNLSPNTITFYRKELTTLVAFLSARGATSTLDVRPDDLRRYLLELENHRSPGGVHCAFRALKAFFYWFESEVEPPNWRNPLKRSKRRKCHKTH